MRAGELASALGGQLSGVESDLLLDGVGALSTATGSQVAFYANPLYRSQLGATTAGMVLIAPSEWKTLAAGEQPAALLIDDPYGGFCLALELLTEKPPHMVQPGTVHPSAVISDSARLGQGVTVGPGCIIGDRVHVGDHTLFEARVVVEPDVRIGERCHLHAGVIVRYNCLLGNRVILQPGVVIGGDGFGFAPTAEGLKKIPQRGRVRLGDDVEIGANSTVDRATFGETVLAEGCKVDNLVMIGHNVEVGPYSILVAQTGISGSARLGTGVQIGGQAGVAGHIKIGDFARIGGQSGVYEDVQAGAALIGTMALPSKEWMRIQVLLRRLPEIWRKVRKL